MNNEQLKAVYAEFLRASKLDGAFAAKCSAPLLLDVKSSWEESSMRLLVIGQETAGWGFEEGKYYRWPYPPIRSYKDLSECNQGIEALMYAYTVFNFGEQQPETHGSPFWLAFRHLGASFSVEPLWSNLFRCSVQRGSTVPKRVGLRHPQLFAG